MGKIWRKIIAAGVAVLVLLVFLWFGWSLSEGISDVQGTLPASSLQVEQQIFWFARLQTMKAVIGFSALILGLISASSAWRAGQKPE